MDGVDLGVRVENVREEAGVRGVRGVQGVRRVEAASRGPCGPVNPFLQNTHLPLQVHGLSCC